MNNTRPLSVAYLVFGLLFLGTFGIWALVSARLITNLNPDWMAPVLLMRSKALSRLIPSRLLPAPQPELVSS